MGSDPPIGPDEAGDLLDQLDDLPAVRRRHWVFAATRLALTRTRMASRSGEVD
jgi:hypothetical protein